jgi:hypothetical protein
MSDIKVYKMNDYEWWASNLSAEETNAFYKQEIGEENDLEDIEECDIDKDGMWWTLDQESKEYEEIQIEFIRTNGENIKMLKQDRSFGDLTKSGCDILKYIPLREAIERIGEYTKPFCIASTEW